MQKGGGEIRRLDVFLGIFSKQTPFFNTRVAGDKLPRFLFYPRLKFAFCLLRYRLCLFLLYDYKGNRAADDYHADYDKHDYQSNVRAALFYSG